MRRIFARFDAEARRAWDALYRAEPRGLFIGAGIALLVLAIVPPLLVVAIPAMLILAIVIALTAFGRAWVREFSFLMHLGDDVFPGQHDKLIWAVLLMVLPPVGIRLFRNFREAHWPEAKPATAHDWL